MQPSELETRLGSLYASIDKTSELLTELTSVLNSSTTTKTAMVVKIVEIRSKISAQLALINFSRKSIFRELSKLLSRIDSSHYDRQLREQAFIISNLRKQVNQLENELHYGTKRKH